MFSPRTKFLCLLLSLLLFGASHFGEAQAVNFGTVAIGQSGAARSVTLTFTSAGSVASQGTLTNGAQNQDFTATSPGNCSVGQSYSVGATCTVSVSFTPLFAGLRAGAVVLKDAVGNTVASTYVSGVGSGPQVGFHVGTGAASFPFLGITADKGIAVDGSGNLFVASSNSGTATESVAEIPAGCSQSSCVKQLPGSFHGIWGLALDGAGNIWVGDVGATGTITEIPASGGYAATKTISGSFGNQIGIAVDGNGNLFFTGSSSGAAYSITEVLAAGGYTTVKTLASGYNSLGGIAVDASGDVFFADSSDRVIKEILAVGGSIPASPTINTIGSGLLSLQDVAIEGSGDLIVTTANSGSAAVSKFVASSGYATSTVLSSGFNGPTGVAVTAGGDLFVVDFGSFGGASLFEIARAAVPAIGFNTPTAPGETDTADGTQNVFLENIGNQPMAISSLAFSNANFSFDGTTTNCTSTGSLAAGDSCNVGIQFNPTTTGAAITGTLAVSDNTLNVAGSAQNLALSGAGLFTPLLSIGLSSRIIAVSQTLTLTVSVSGGSGNPSPTGTVQVAAVGYTSPAIALVNGSATLTIPPGSLTPGTFTLAFTYIPGGASSSVYTPASGRASVTVTSTLLNLPVITVTPAVPSISLGQPLSVTVAVAQTSGSPVPTGTITLAGGNYQSPATPLILGTVTLTIPANSLILGTDLLTASYTPDSASGSIYVPANGTGFVAVSAVAVASAGTPVDFGSIAIGTTSATQPITLTFPANSTPATLIATTQGATGKDFAVVAGGTCSAGINVATGQSCTVNIAFRPAFAGLRNGAVLALDSNGQTLALTYIHGNGIGPQITFQTDAYYSYYGIRQTGYPFSITTLSDGFSHPNVAVDGSGNVFEADLGTGSLKEIPAGCTSASCTVTILQAFYGPSALAVDGAGNIFVTEVGNGDVRKIPPGCKSYTCMQTIASGFNQPYGLSVDSSGNVFVADTFNNAIKEVVAQGGYTTIKTLATGLDLPWSVVVNGADDLFIAEGGDQCTTFIPSVCSTINTLILQIPAAGGYQTVKTLSSGGFGKPFGLAIDSGGNLFEADYGDSCSTEFTAGSAYASSLRLCSPALVQFPEGMAVDSADNLYFDDVIKGQIYKMDYVDPPAITFKTATQQAVADVQDGPQIVGIQNNGTAPMTLSSIALSDSSFRLDNITTCSTSTPLAVGSSCYLAVDFQPTRTGPLSATLTLTDNNLNVNSVTQVIQIAAVALPPVPVILSNPTNPTTASSATFTFSDTQTPITFVCSIDSLPFSACSSPATFAGLSGGTHSFQVRAKDSAANLSNAAVYNWLINSVGPPAPVITSAPAYLTNDDTAAFAFTDSQPGVTFQCSLDGATFVSCVSGVNYSGLAGFANNYTIYTKRHTFAVKAMDSSGNFSPITNRPWTDISTPFSAYPVDFGMVPVGQTSAQQSVTFKIVSDVVHKAGTVATIDALTLGVTGLDFTVSDPGTCAVGTALASGTTCTLKVTFTPRYPGQRLGGVLLLDSSGNGLGEAYLQGTGTGPQVSFAPYSTVAYNILAPQNNSDPGKNLLAPATGVTLDGAGSVYVSDYLIGSVDSSVAVSSGDIWKFPSGCTGPTCSTLFASTAGNAVSTVQPILPTGVAMDGLGVLWETSYALFPNAIDTIGNWYDSQCTYVAQLSNWSGVAVDGAGDLAFSGNGYINSCYYNLGVGQTSQTRSFDFSATTPSLTVDPQSDYFVADTGNNAIKEVLASSGYTISRTIGSGFNAPAGVASDAYGNIFVSDTGNKALKEITASSGYTQVLTLASFGANGIAPQNLTVDALGNVFITTASVVNSNVAGLTGQLVKLDFADTPALSFPTQTKIGTTDTVDGTLTATVKNNGNQLLTLTGLALSNTNFSIDTSATTCSISTPLAAGASCTVGVLFTPNGNGSLTGTLTLTDNALNATGSTQQFALSGTSFLTPATFTPPVTVTPNSTSITTAQSDGVTVTVAAKSGGPIPTGTISLVGGSYTSATVSLSGGSATFTLPAGVLAIGSTTLNAIYTPDTASSTTYGVGAGSTSITVAAINSSTPTVTVSPASFGINTQQSLAVTIAVSGGGGSAPTPTGTVTLSGGNFASTAATLSNGTALITIPAGFLPAGADTLTAYYTPDYLAQPNYKSASGTGQVSVEASLKLTPAITVTPAASTIQTTQPLQVTLQVSGGSGKPTPTGSVVLSNGSYTASAAALTQGGVIFSIPAGALAAGSDTLTALYTPDNASNLTFNNASGRGLVTVNAPLVATATMVQASATPVVSGTSVTFTVMVAPLSGAVTPTGQILLTDGSSTLATLTLNGSGAASYPTTALTVGTHLIAAAYQGDSISAASTSSPVSIVVTAPTVQITVGTSPAGLSFTADGTTYTSPQNLSWIAGSTHTLTTTSTQTSNGTQSTFASWSDAGAISHSVTAPSSAASFTASFNTAYQLTTSAAPSSGGSVLPASGTFYPAGSVVNLTASPKAGYSFSSWTGSVANAVSASTTIAMNAPQNATANFAVIPLPVAALAPGSLSFTSVAGTSSAAQLATLSNTGSVPLTISGITITGINPGAFAQTTTCGTSLAAGASCAISVTFTPSSAASFAATLSVADNASTSPQTVALTGTATPAPSFTVLSSTLPQIVKPGGIALYSITVTAQNGTISAPVALSVSGVPPGATATFSPASVTPASTSATSQLSIQTSAVLPAGQRSGWPLSAALLPLFGLVFTTRRTRRNWIALAFLSFLSLAAVATLTGCGGGFGSPTGGSRSFVITITGTSGTLQQTTTVQLTID